MDTQFIRTKTMENGYFFNLLILRVLSIYRTKRGSDVYKLTIIRREAVSKT